MSSSGVFVGESQRSLGALDALEGGSFDIGNGGHGVLSEKEDLRRRRAIAAVAAALSRAEDSGDADNGEPCIWIDAVFLFRFTVFGDALTGIHARAARPENPAHATRKT